MPVIYMKHEIHGAKIANLEAEAAADEKNGWVRYTPETASATEDSAPKKEVKPRARKVAEPEQPAAEEVPNFLAPAESTGA
jgi:hypothetical protein